jgi:hypothetical protein
MPTEIENKEWDEMVENKIFVFDDLVQQEHINQLSGIINASGWSYGQCGNTSHKEYESLKEYEELDDRGQHGVSFWDQHWGYHFMNQALQCKQPFGVYELWKGIQKVASDRMKLDLTLINVYAIGTTTDRVGFSHVDWTPALEHWTALYYVNPIWKSNWGGETVFYTDDKETDILKAVMPKPGRFVVFNAAIPHRSSPPTSVFRGLRTSISFKLIQNKFAYQGLEVVADYKAAPWGSKEYIEREEILKGW